MSALRVSAGVVHSVPQDVRRIITATPAVYTLWQDITPLARNEWLCWVISAKQEETRVRRIRIMQEKLMRGDRRPCCFAGCPHRARTGKGTT